MDETALHVPVPLPREQITAYLEEHGSTRLALRVIQLSLAAGGPQEKFATLANLIATDLAFVPSVAAEVRAIGQKVASLSPIAFARLQHLAWTDCSDTEGDTR